jgi:hypothetical protein
MLDNRDCWWSRYSQQLEPALQPPNRQTAQRELLLKILGHGQLFVLRRGNVKRFHHHTGCTVTVKGIEHLLPDSSILSIGQNLLLPTAVEQCSRLSSESCHEVPVVDAADSSPSMTR